MNLMSNAIDTLEGRGTITVTTGVREGWFELCVADTGRGIPEAVLARVFDPFVTTKSVGQDTGLGLSITHSIARKHGGEIELW